MQTIVTFSSMTPAPRYARKNILVPTTACAEGPGLTAEDQAQAFGPFQRLSAKPTGGEYSTGLGLSIVKQMVELHGGQVWIESEPGHGATFCLELPLRTAPYPVKP
jgi:signal transduction histidine kinase